MLKRDATNRKYSRTRSQQFLYQLLALANLYEKKSEAARRVYMHNQIGDAIDNGKNLLKGLRNLGLVSKTCDAFNTSMSEELNDYFSSVVVSSSEDAASELVFYQWLEQT